MMRPHVLSTFIYAIVITLAAFIVRNTLWLAIASLVSIIIGSIYGGRRILYMLLLVVIGFFGVFLNALFFANTGREVASIGFITVREHAIEESVIVALRLLLIAGAGSVLALTHSSSEIARGLTRELGLPYSIALAVAFALRSMPLIKQDLDDIVFMRKQRGYGRIPLTPSGVSSVLTPLLSIGYNRALWGGISAELRGLRGIRYQRSITLNIMDILLFVILAVLLLCLLIIQ